MSYAFYLDPCKKSVTPDLPEETPSVAYWRLIDCSEEQINDFMPEEHPQADFTVAEIHPSQLDLLQVPVNRLSIVQSKSVFRDLTLLKSKLQDIQCDITFNWDKRFSVDYYMKMLRFWLQCGVQHISIYELSDFAKWQRLQGILREYNFHFYDRYHACLPGYESPYQKHIAGFGNLFAVGGWSRVTAGNITHVKGPTQKNWDLLSEEDQIVEKLLFAFADRQGMEMEKLKPYLAMHGLSKAMGSGLVAMNGSRVVPTDQGLWDTVELVSQLHNN
jgi:coproporphyrinogen III oxidase-like Fe-S oxidoreductase